MPAGFEGEVFLEDLHDLGRIGFAVCAFFTPGDGYERYARRLARSCSRFGLPYSVWRAPAVHRSISRRGSADLRFTKPSFITFNLERMAGCDVAYLDVDTFFVANPVTLLEARASRSDLAVYNWLNDPQNEAYLPDNRKLVSAERRSDFYVFSHRVGWSSTEQLVCSGLTQFHGNTDAARLLLAAWQQAIAANPNSADDDCLNFAHNHATRQGLRLRHLWLTKSYARYPWWPHVEPVVLHPDIPALAQVHAPVAELDGWGAVDLGHCTLNDAPPLFPADGGVDVRTGTVFRVKAEKRPVPSGHYAGRFWIYGPDEGLDA